MTALFYKSHRGIYMKPSLDIYSQNSLDRLRLNRNHVEQLRSRIKFLQPDERALMTLYFENNSGVTQLAMLLGKSQSSISRRIHKIIHRLSDNRFILSLQYRSRFSGYEISLIRERYIQGKPMSQIADSRGVTYYSIRQTFKKINKKLKEIQAGAKKT